MLEREFKNVQVSMEKEFTKKIASITQKYEESKRALDKVFTPLLQKCAQVKEAFEVLRFSIWKAFTMYSGSKENDEN